MTTDLKYAVRMLLKAPAFTIIAVLTLALGIGANSAIFSVVDTVLLRPLNFPQSDQIVRIFGTHLNAPDTRETDSLPDFYDLRAQSKSFSAMAGYSGAGTVLTGAGESQQLLGVAVVGDFFETMGTQPLRGRYFTAEEAKVGAPNVVLISHGLWQRAFGSDPRVVGQEVTLAGRSYTLLGVMPPGWKFPVEATQSDFITPLEPYVANQVPLRGSHFVHSLGRLGPGVTPEAAGTELKTIAARLAAQYPDTNTGRSVVVQPLLESIVGDVQPALLILLGAVALVLLIACANVANLLLARAAARSREIGIRAALGASRAVIVRQLLAESLLLALVGGALGLVLAGWVIDWLGRFGPDNVPRLAEVHVNLAVGGFTFGVAVLSTLIFGLVPALQVSRANVNEALQQGAKGSTGGIHGNRARAALVISQVSLSLLLLAGAGLLVKSFFNLRATNPGFDPAHLFVLDEVIPRTKYSEEDAQRRFYRELLPKLERLPGVEAIGGAYPMPFSGNDSNNSFTIAGQPDPGRGNHPDASLLSTTPGYFRTMKIPLRAGRHFDERDNETARQVAIVNETFARRFLPMGDPIGQNILLDTTETGATPIEIVGVVADTKQNELSAPSLPEIYRPFAQAPNRRLFIVLRTATERLAGMHNAVRKLVHEQDTDVFVGGIDPMSYFIGKKLAQPKFNMLLLGLFAGVALLLAAIGIYGVIAYSVAQRTREIGIRMALGAQRTQMLGMILRQSGTLIVVGLGIGLVAALAATRVLVSLLYGVAAIDPWIYALAVALLGGAALLASYFPARRAMKVDPMIALRCE